MKLVPALHLPEDDLERQPGMVTADDDSAVHIGLMGDTYTILVRGEDTAGRFCVIDMLVPEGGGPRPHRHDFEESFLVLDGEIEVTVRGKALRLKAGQTASIPANAPHQFRNRGAKIAHLTCICAPAGQEEFFERIGELLPSRTTVAAPLSGEELEQFEAKARELAPLYRTEFLDHA